MALAALAIWTAAIVQRATANTAISTLLPQMSSGYVTTQNAYPSTTTQTGNQTTPPSTQTASISNVTSNWAGYAASGQSVTAVHGTWTVPSVTATGYAAADATWIGIGGISSNDLIQTGTQNTMDANGNLQTSAFYEMLPDAETNVPDFAVSPGNSITAELSQTSDGLWQINLHNNTTGANYQNQVEYDSSLSSAEWVEEDPSDGISQVPLDTFAAVPFTHATTVINGDFQSAQAAGAQTMTIMGDGGAQLADISTLTQSGEAFTVTRTSASSVTSTAPSGRWSRHGMGAGDGSGRFWRHQSNVW